MKPLTYQRKPSPTNQNKFQDSAQVPERSSDSGRYRESVCGRSIEGGSLSASRSKGYKFFRKLKNVVISGYVSAGMTVEASVVLPLLLFFFLNLGCAIEMIRLHGSLQLALWQIGSELSVYGYAVDSGELPEEGGQEDSWWKGLAGVIFAASYVKSRLIDTLGDSYLEQSPLSKGTDSLLLWESEIFGSGDEMDIVVTYSVSPWSKLAGFFSFRMANRYYSHIWNGYQLPGAAGKEVKTVYLAENASVYHLSRDCTHLRLSVSQILTAELGGARNQYGRRYRPCDKCTDGAEMAVCYITQEGDCYHYIRECPGLKRTVYAVSLEDAAGYRLCSRCRQKGW